MKKTVLITGADGNLGKVVVEKFLDKGHQLIAIAGNNYQKGLPDNENLEVLKADLSDEASSKPLAEKLINKYNNIDAAIFLAGGFAAGKINNTSQEQLEEMYKLNFLSAYHLAQTLFNHMLAKGKGRLVFTSARPAFNAAEGKNAIAYALSKGLINQFADLLNATAKGKDVIASVIAPSTIDTPANRQAMPDADFSKWVSREAIAESLNFLISDESEVLREPILKLFGNA